MTEETLYTLPITLQNPHEINCSKEDFEEALSLIREITKKTDSDKVLNALETLQKSHQNQEERKQKKIRKIVKEIVKLIEASSDINLNDFSEAALILAAYKNGTNKTSVAKIAKIMEIPDILTPEEIFDTKFLSQTVEETIRPLSVRLPDQLQARWGKIFQSSNIEASKLTIGHLLQWSGEENIINEKGNLELLIGKNLTQTIGKLLRNEFNIPNYPLTSKERERIKNIVDPEE